MRIRRAVSTTVLATMLAACTAGQTTAPNINNVNPLDPNYSKLQLAVGTANLYGTTTGLNVVATLRQPSGASATGVNTPILTGPFAFSTGPQPAVGSALSDPYLTVVNNGPSLPETSAAQVAIRGTPQSVAPGTPFCDGVGSVPAGFTACPAGIAPNATTFGQSGGIFAMGLAPYNHVGTTGQSYSYQPYPVPLYNQSTHPVFVPWGGPPAFDPDNDGMGTRDGLVILGVDSFGVAFFLGVGEGITAFDGVTPSSTGAYTLTAQIGVLGSNGQPTVGNISASANLPSLATVLPLVTAPTVTPDGTGGATFTATLPGGVTQAYVQIVDYGPGAGPTHSSLTAPNCQGSKGTSFAPVYYTVEITATGAYSLGALHGPNTALSGTNLTPSPSICTAAQNNVATGTAIGDNFTVQMIGFDYPAYQAAQSLLAGGIQAPAITGPSGQSDITISVPVEEDAPGYAPTPLAASRHPLSRPGARGFGPTYLAPDVARKLGLPGSH